MGSISNAANGIFHWQSFRLCYGPRVNSVCNKNEYHEYFLGDKGGKSIGLTILPPSCANCLEIWEPQTHGTLRLCPGLYRDCSTFLLHYSLPGRLHNRHLLLHVQKIWHCPYHKPCKPFSSSGDFCHFLGHLKPLSEVCLMITVSAKLLLSDKMAVTSRWLMMEQT